MFHHRHHHHHRTQINISGSNNCLNDRQWLTVTHRSILDSRQTFSQRYRSWFWLLSPLSSSSSSSSFTYRSYHIEKFKTCGPGVYILVVPAIIIIIIIIIIIYLPILQYREVQDVWPRCVHPRGSRVGHNVLLRERRASGMASWPQRGPDVLQGRRLRSEENRTRRQVHQPSQGQDDQGRQS